MNCRPGCGACCIAPSISSPIPGTPGTARAAGMPQGKPAGVRCIQLDSANQCLIFGQPGWPAVCAQLQAAPDMCGADAGHALVFLARLEEQTRPGYPERQPARPDASSKGSEVISIQP